LAEEWQRMAAGWDGPPPAATEHAEPTVQQQQQQQIQPKDGKKE
jgi:hypothetical protein